MPPRPSRAPWHRRGAYAAIAIALLGWVTFAITLLISLGHRSHDAPAENIQGTVRAGLAVSVACFVAATSLGVRARHEQPIGALAALLFVAAWAALCAYWFALGML